MSTVGPYAKLRRPLHIARERIAVDAATAPNGEARSLRWASIDLALAATTGALHLAWPLFDVPRMAFLLAIVPFWLGYLTLRVRAEPRLLQAWGLDTQQWKRGWSWPLVVLFTGFAGMTALGLWFGNAQVTPWLIGGMALYPVWGFVQQLLVQGVMADGMIKIGAPRQVVVLAAAVVFGLMHWPFGGLMAATAVMALLMTPWFLRTRNLLPLALVHGWLGTLWYLWVMGVDPAAKMFG